MDGHLTAGQEGENKAEEWLQQRGYTILHRNWRYRHYEIDIIASKDRWLHFIEVKLRNRSAFGHPEDAVSKKKFRNLQRAADQYLQFNTEFRWIQYDILAITVFRQKDPEFFLIEDVFL